MLKEKKITQLEVKKAILKMKNNKSWDRSRCKAEWLKEVRDEEEGQIPLQLRETSKEKIQKIQRSIFITNIVPKAFEIVKKKEAIQNNMFNM